MDPVTIALTLLLKNPAQTATTVQNATEPGQIDVAKMQGSLADLSRGVLTCYHKTARFNQVDVLQLPWDRQQQYAADNSAVLKIAYQGVSMARYEMAVAVMTKGNAVRTSVLADNAIIPYSKKCKLEEWTTE
ncbi:MAG: hypothetical protein AB9M53_06095 [Leptothrix sp. (in: b-proteobacteria)]